MISNVATHEAERLLRLRSYALLGAAADPRLDELARLAAFACGAPIALINLVDEDRVWVRAHSGVELCEAPRDAMMCAHAISDMQPLVIPDLTRDERFAHTQFVIGPPDVRFYAGAPLLTDDGFALGTVCVLDTTPRTLEPAQLAALQTIARQAMAWLELQRTTQTLETVIAQSADGIVIADERGRLSLNPTARELVAVDGAPVTVNSLPLGAGADGQPLGRNDTPIVRAMNGDVVRSFRWRVDVAGGTRILEASASPLRRPDGSRAGAVLIVRDQTARVRLEEALAENRDEARMLLDSTSEGIYGVDREGRCTFVNASALRLLGYERDAELLGKDVHELLHVHDDVHDDNGRGATCPIHGAAATHLEDASIRRRDGSALAVEVWSSPVFRRGAVIGCVVTFADVSERRRADQERERALSEAYEALHARDEFLSIAAHELRTPVTALQLQAQSIRRQGHENMPGPVAERLDQLLRQGERLATLINQLLDVSRISRNRLELDPEEVELRGLVCDVVARYAAQAKRVGCTVAVEAPTEVHGIWDRGRIEQVVTNLLSNAMKYGRGRPIHLTVRASKNEAVFSVRDEGIGISAEDQARIFERFERAAPLRHFGGLGLGLFIVRQIVEASGGTIEVDSNPGKGATFTVRLPRGKA